MQTVPELADLPVIFISGYGRDETIARALEAGADDCIVKPFSPTELTARIRAARSDRSRYSHLQADGSSRVLIAGTCFANWRRVPRTILLSELNRRCLD